MLRLFAVLLFVILCLFPIRSRAADPSTSTPKEIDLLGEETKEFQRHNYKKVIQLYRDFEESHPDRYLPLSARILYSQALADTGEMNEAIKSLKDILSELPPQADTLKLQYDLANLLFIQRRFDEAKTLYQKMLL